MTLGEALRELESLGTEQNRKVYRRHRAAGDLFGVSFANLDALAKRIRTNHSLALELWRTGDADARMLAVRIVDPSQFDETTADDWVRSTTYYALISQVATRVVARTLYRRRKVAEWTASDDEWVGRAGWHLLAQMAMSDDDLSDDFFEPFLTVIESEIHERKNRTRDAMNDALIAIGGRTPMLHDRAVDAAKRIGKVTVDHGETGCKTPDAIPYMERMWARKNARLVREASRASSKRTQPENTVGRRDEPV